MIDFEQLLTPEVKAQLVRAGSMKREESLAAVAEMAVAFTGPLRKGVMSGDITNGIFNVINLTSNATSEFPLDFLRPGMEKDFVAYTIPNHGRIPERHVEGDYVMVPTYEIGSSIDMLLKYARDARWDVVGSALKVLNQTFVKKINDDAWHTLIAAGVDRNVTVYDPDAGSGQISKQLISNLKIAMRRNGGGNSTSINRGKLTDAFTSPEVIESIRNWGVDEVDEVTRRELITQEGGLITRIFQVNLHDLDELGDDQEYQLFFENDLAGTMPTGDSEIIVGLDLSNRDSFVMPVRSGVQIFEDETLHRQRRMGWYGWAELGFAVLDNRRVIIGTC